MKVRIYQPCKSAMQSGRAKGKEWRVEPELTSARTPEPLMGWSSSQDTLNQVRLSFKTCEDAIAFATRKGWEYEVESVAERRITPRNYGDNFAKRKKVAS